jgi:hypothetical protein
MSKRNYWTNKVSTKGLIFRMEVCKIVKYTHSLRLKSCKEKITLGRREYSRIKKVKLTRMLGNIGLGRDL